MDIRNEIDKVLEGVEEDVALKVKKDVFQRIADWITGGGSLDDAYIERQINYCREIATVYQKGVTK